MSINSVICVYLLTCFTWDRPLTDNCPNSCQCFSAPEGGYGEDTALSLICKWDDIINPIHFRSLRNKKNINTFVLNNVRNERTGGRAIPYKIFTDLSIKNLVFKDSNFYFSSNDFDGLNKDDLNVLTFINTNLVEKSGTGVDFSSFVDFKQIKAIYFSDGSFTRITNQFHVMPVHNVIFLSIKRAKLNSIDKNAFEKFKSLKMLTISENEIKSLDWLPTIDSSLRYLDLRNNQIKSFPLKLTESLTKLMTLQLGGNDIHVFTGNTMDLLINRLKELSFEPINNGVTKKQYFYLTEDMKWIYYYSDEVPDHYTNQPKFLKESLNQYDCIKWDQDPFPCYFWGINDYNYPYKAITEHLAAVYVDPHYFLSYLNERIILSGAVIPFKNTLDMYWLDRVAVDGNTIKINLDTNIWYDFKESASSSQKFEEMINKLKNFLTEAQNKGIFVIINLWQSHLMPNELLANEYVFEAYSNNHLKPLVTKLNQFKSLAAWNLLDDPDRLVITGEPAGERCLNTVDFIRINHADEIFPIKSVQNFIAKQAQIIHEIEPRKLVTVAFSEQNTFYSYNGIRFNYFQDECLINSMDNKCTGDDCTLDIYSVLLEETSQLYNVDIKPQDLSQDSPKPIILIAGENTNNIQEFYANVVAKYEGFISTFNEDKNMPANKIIDEGMKALKRNHDEFIGKSNDKNPFL